MFKKEDLSSVEYNFIRAYVGVLSRDYYLLRSVLQLMRPDDLAVPDVCTATQLAIKVARLHDEFEAQLHAITRHKDYRYKSIPAGPTTLEMADLLSLSFFSVSVATNPKKPPVNNGLFSGEPATLAMTIKQLQKMQDGLSGSSSVLDQFLKLLQAFPPVADENNIFAFWSNVSDMFKNISSAGNDYEPDDWDDYEDDDEDEEDEHDDDDYYEDDDDEEDDDWDDDEY
jgi:hypothetical protein